MSERLGRYVLERRIGVGGMGEVFRAIAVGEAGFARPLAIKRLLPLLSRDAGFVRAFVAEARLAARLHHPGIVQVYEFAQAGEHHYLSMELVDGVDLGRVGAAIRRAQRPLEAGVACFVASEVAAALDYAHALGDDDGRSLELVHRDVTPSNVMVTAAGAVKLLDFGVAKVSARIADERTRTGVLKGKAGYVSPEAADGRAVDRRGDLFALGVVLWELLAARRLFHGVDELDALRRVRAAEVPPLDAPPDVDAVVRRLLARAPDARFATGAEVVDALAPIVHRLGGDALTLGRATAAFIADAADDPADEPRAPTLDQRPRSRRRWPWSRG
jgi:eukaryotic-like serine/threonine-protein kinase